MGNIVSIPLEGIPLKGILKEGIGNDNMEVTSESKVNGLRFLSMAISVL